MALGTTVWCCFQRVTVKYLKVSETLIHHGLDKGLFLIVAVIKTSKAVNHKGFAGLAVIFVASVVKRNNDLLAPSWLSHCHGKSITSAHFSTPPVRCS